eukprot:maker-scaffold426_size175065-snap-gene-0.29 protein:Tk08637 transcript:maker-scaffold426_size175065-snap-gene-0.29-mRNA-1 annotation:"m-phase-specific plk1-interacting"
MAESGPDKLANPFDTPKTDDFLAFSASTPVSSPGNPQRGSKPRFGRNQRQNNWQRFDDYQNYQQQPGNASPHMGYGRGNSRGGGPNQRFQRGSGNSPRFQRGGQTSPQWRGNDRRRGRDNHPRGSRGGQRGGNQDSQSFFHPSMLEDPWARFEQCSNASSADVSMPSMSDSMIPQVGDSFFERNINPAPNVQASSTSLDTGGDEADESRTNSASNPESSLEKPELSESMIPMVGDSILNQNDATNMEEEDDVSQPESPVKAAE